MLELLAPAGDMECFKTAIANGADAVYLGLDNFNARMKAENFDSTNIASVVRYAHFYGVKVYVTLNTILQNCEFRELIDTVKVAIDAKVDAFLVQDLGVAKVLRDCFSNIVLHASTQMGIHNLYGAKIAEEFGIKRVVLSRETKLKDIVAIRQNTNLEIEYFVQGALCVCFSGNCYMSSREFGASGNRGLCKQTCRLPYEARLGDKTKQGFLLSARDLCLANEIYTLAKAGVSSFKIEGRMRRAGYVATAVNVYRKAIDSVLKEDKTSACQSDESQNNACKTTRISKEDESALKVAFSRGEYLPRAYLDDGVPKIVDSKFQNHIGIEIGKVVSVKPFKQDLFEAVVYSSRELKAGDGLKFVYENKERASVGIGEVKKVGGNLYRFITKARLQPDWSVRLILSAEQDEKMLGAIRTVGINMYVEANAGYPLKMVAESADGKISVCVEAQNVLEKAIKIATSAEEISAQCKKTGESGFEVINCSVQTGGVFAAKSVVNALRRQALDRLKDKIVESNEPLSVAVNNENLQKIYNILNNSTKFSRQTLHFVREEDINENSAQTDGNSIIVLCPKDYKPQAVSKAIDRLCANGTSIENVALQLPIIANGDDLKVLEDAIAQSGVKTLVSENIYGLYFAKREHRIIAGQGHNVANAIACHTLKEFGVEGAVCSVEYPDFESDGETPLYNPDMDIPVMTFAHCPYKTFFDNDCARCTYRDGLTLSRAGNNYTVRRIRLAQCYFSLCADN